jgi:hypothetical protein
LAVSWTLSVVVMPRRPGDVGLYFLMPMIQPQSSP